MVEGLQETFWLYPQNLTYGAWPASGEIDFAEFYSEFPGLDVPYVHYSQSSTDPNATSYDCIINQDAFNTYGVDWTPTSITVMYNGQPCLVDHPTHGQRAVQPAVLHRPHPGARGRHQRLDAERDAAPGHDPDRLGAGLAPGLLGRPPRRAGPPPSRAAAPYALDMQPDGCLSRSCSQMVA